MRLVVRILGCEVFALDTDPVDDRSHPDLISVERHGGDFGFGASPVRPYWDAGEAPDVARSR